MKKFINENKGFSLIELIVVITIMVILVAILVPNVVGNIAKARNSQAAAQAKVIYTAATTAIAEQKTNTQSPDLSLTWDGEALKRYIKDNGLLDKNFDLIYDEVTIVYNKDTQFVESVSFRGYTYP